MSTDLLGHKKNIVSLSWSSDGNLASGSYDSTVSKTIYELKGHSDIVNAVCFNPINPNLIATASSDTKTLICDIRQPDPIHTIQTTTSYLNLHWKPDGSQIVIATKSDILEIYDTLQWKQIQHQIDTSSGVNEVKWDRSGKILAVTYVHGMVRFFNSSDFKLNRKMYTNGGMAVSLEFSQDGQYFAVGGSDGIASVWRMEDLICFKNYLKSGSLKSLSFAANSHNLATGHDNLEVDNFLSGENVFKVSTPMNCVAMHPRVDILAVAPDEKTQEPKVKIYKV